MHIMQRLFYFANGEHQVGLASLSSLRSVQSNLQAQSLLVRAVSVDNESATLMRKR